MKAHTHLVQQIDMSSDSGSEAASERNSTGGSGMGPCCTPAGYRPLTLLYINKAGTVHERQIEGMSVTKCICI